MNPRPCCATNYQNHRDTQRRKIACLEEMFPQRLITRQRFETCEILKKNQYGQYLKDVWTENISYAKNGVNYIASAENLYSVF